ncbi:MAG: DUF3048 domain-containing protein [Saccharofermentanales bacterium]|jgi:hypothetical protein|nr:DUF3048 domain-containing protein [Bacillota bacterium]
MKKYLIILLVVFLAFGFIGCKKKAEETDLSETTGTEQVQTSSETATEATATNLPATEISAPTVTETEPTETEPPLPGGDVELLFPDRYPIAAMINNKAAARPQSGLSKAKLIYQMMTEARTTRLLMLIDATEGVIGPVRSARPAYLDLVAQHRAFYVHAGNYKVIEASPVKNNIRSLDALHGHYGMYYRTEHRKSPHNLYTTMEAAYKRAGKIYGDIAPSEPVRGLYVRSEFLLPAGGETATKIKYQFSKTKEAFTYDAKSQTYRKYNDGKVLVDEQTKKDLKVANIIVLHRPHDLMPNGVHNKINWIDKGEATYLTGGKKYTITWSKASHTDPIIYYLEGEELVLNPGLTWIIVVDGRALKTVSYE